MERNAPPVVLELASGCVRFVQQAVGLELDFTAETLPVLDHYVQLAEPERDELLELLAPTAGAYFGEVVRRTLGPARWHAPEADYQRFRIELEDCFLWFNPVGVAIEAILVEPADGWSAHLSLLDEDRPEVEAALERLGEVPEDDYYRFATRYEVLSQVATLLRARAARAGASSRRFGPDVYAAAIDEAPLKGLTH